MNRVAYCLSLGLLLACGGDEPTTGSDVGIDVSGAADTDVSTDVADVPVVDVEHDAVVIPDATPDADVEQPPPFRISLPASFRPEAPYPVVLYAITDDGSIDESVSGVLGVGAEGVVDDGHLDVLMRRGVGSITTRVVGEGELTIGNIPVASLTLDANEPLSISGEVGPQEWTSGTTYAVDGDLSVGGDLTIEPGVWVIVSDETNIDVEGSVYADGTPDFPIVFAPSATAWGGIRVEGNSEFANTFFVGGGADASREFGHSDSQPILYALDVQVSLERCVFQDSPGKAMGARGGEWTISESVVARTDTGGEFEQVAVTVMDSHYFDFPEQDPAPRDDDNDAIYLLGDPSDDSPPLSRIVRSTFLSGADDGVDHNGSTVTIEESWIEGFDNECIAASSGGSMTVSDTALVGCGQGLEAGYGSPTVVGSHLLIMECGVGLRFGDNYTRDYTGTLNVSDSVVFANAEHAVWNWLFSTEAPAEGRLTVDHSLIDVDEAEGADNIIGTPVLNANSQLAQDSPGLGGASDGGDPGLQTPRPR